MANGGNVYFVPPEYTALGGLQQGIAQVQQGLERRAAKKEREADRKVDAAMRAFQVHMSVGDKLGAARAAFLGGLTNTTPQPNKSVEEMFADLMQRGMEKPDTLNETEKLLFNKQFLDTLDPELAQRVAQAGLDLTTAQIVNLDSATARQDIERMLMEREADQEAAFYNDFYRDGPNLGRWGFEKFLGDREHVLKLRQLKLDERMTNAQIELLKQQTAATRQEVEATLAGPQAKLVDDYVADRARTLSGMLMRPVPAASVIAYARNPDDATIAPEHKNVLDAAQAMLTNDIQQAAEAAYLELQGTRNGVLLDIAAAMPDDGAALFSAPAGSDTNLTLADVLAMDAANTAFGAGTATVGRRGTLFGSRDRIQLNAFERDEVTQALVRVAREQGGASVTATPEETFNAFVLQAEEAGLPPAEMLSMIEGLNDGPEKKQFLSLYEQRFGTTEDVVTEAAETEEAPTQLPGILSRAIAEQERRVAVAQQNLERRGPSERWQTMLEDASKQIEDLRSGKADYSQMIAELEREISIRRRQEFSRGDRGNWDRINRLESDLAELRRLAGGR